MSFKCFHIAYMCRIHMLFKPFKSVYIHKLHTLGENWLKMAMFQLFLIYVTVVQICDSNSHQTEIEDVIMKKVKQYVADEIKSSRCQVKALLILLSTNTIISHGDHIGQESIPVGCVPPAWKPPGGGGDAVLGGAVLGKVPQEVTSLNTPCGQTHCKSPSRNLVCGR